MIKIGNKIVKEQHNFWNHCLFHPTDAVEDSWGKRILDRMAEDEAVKTVRIYTMLEDIVYLDEFDRLQYDFRANDLRIDYLLEKGFEPLLAYTTVPDCIAQSTENKTTAAKGKTRYKGKMFNTAPPKDIALWEEVCYQYTLHVVERYGIERVSTWRVQCFNEPDIPGFFLSQLTREFVQERIDAYCPMYAAFARAVKRVSPRIQIGGPTLANRVEFLDGFLSYVKENDLPMDYIALHNYGTYPRRLTEGTEKLTVENNMRRHEGYMEVIRKYGFENKEIIMDEWGAATSGFFNREEAPELMFRETEVFSAYFAKLIQRFIDSDYKLSKMLICLSGQHEMVEDFSGFRNFFTLNFIAKPIYNAFLLAKKLHGGLVECSADRENVHVVPTRNEKGAYSVMLSYSSEYFEEEIPDVEETLSFAEDLSGKNVTLWCIDRNTTNPYRLFQREGISSTPTREEIARLREEGRLKPVLQYRADSSSLRPISLTPNSVYLVTVEA